MKPRALKWWMSLAVIAGLILTGGMAYAQNALGLATVGAVDPANGFPKFYKDGNGLKLAPCLVAGAADPCGLVAAGALPLPASPIAFPLNFPAEFPYARLSARISGVNLGLGRADLDLVLNAAFAGGVAPTAGLQVVFARYRIRITGGLTPGGLYTVTTPYGTRQFLGSAAGTLNFTDDQGCLAAPCNFAAVLANTNVGPFLTWNPIADAPVGFIGNPAATHVITAGPSGAVFSIAGPGIGTVTDINRDFTSTDQWTVAGRIFIPPATTTTLTASPNPAGPPGLVPNVTLTATVRPVPPATGVADGTVTFKDGLTVLGTATLNAAGVATFGATLAVGTHSLTAAYSGSDNFSASTSAAVTETVLAVAPPPVTDTVTINLAQQVLGTGELRIEGVNGRRTTGGFAATDEIHDGAALGASCPGALIGTVSVNPADGTWRFRQNVAARPTTICVHSVAGGTATRAVTPK